MTDINIVDTDYMPDIYNNLEYYDRTPDIYNLDDFNRKTHGDIVHIKYNNIEEHIEIIFNNIIITSKEFNKAKLLNNYIIKINILKLIKKFNKFNNSTFKMFIISDIEKDKDIISGMYMMSDCTYTDFVFINDLQIYIKKYCNLPASSWYWDYYKDYNPDIILVTTGPRIGAFMLFSNEPIEPLFHFNLDKMKYIKKYIFDTECGFKMIYNIYKYHNMVFVYLTHLANDNGDKYIMAWWDKESGEFLANFDNLYRFINNDFNEITKSINFKSIIGDYKYTFVYRYSI